MSENLSAHVDRLFEPLQLGTLTLSNRITMAPLTRSRAGRDGVPSQLHVDYYSQRASAGLIVTEGTFPAATARSFPGQAGIETPEQVAAWKRVTDAIHPQGGTVFMQIMHPGRQTHAELQEGNKPEAPSAIAPGTAVRNWTERKDCPTPRALDNADIARVIDQFRTAGRNAIEAGMDGVELHSANGYLLHQFLAPNSNQRTDDYGGSPAGRYRIVVDTLRALATEIGGERVGVRLSPQSGAGGTLEPDLADVRATYGGLLDAVADLNLAYVSFLYAEPNSPLMAELSAKARANGHTRVIMNSGFHTVTQRDDAVEQISLDYVDALAVGRNFISNPDLVRRWRKNADLNVPDQSTFYTSGERGYTDYPTLD